MNSSTIRRARVLVTGNHGYIGSVLAPFLADAGYDVVGLDAEYYHECTLVPPRADVPTITKDLRDVVKQDLEGFDAVVHLAALSNDPLGNLNAAVTRAINLDATVQVAELARAAGVRRFLFASSCIMYGLSAAQSVDETSPLAPVTEYARSKAAAERALSSLARDGFSVTFLRNGTIYGPSPRMRFDTVLNDLMGAAVTEGRFVIHGDGQPWRPVVHIDDVARAFAAVLEAPESAVHDQAFNTGADALNIRMADLATIVAQTVPGSEYVVANGAGKDRRSYRADFSKFAKTFPGVRFRTPAEGALDLYNAFSAIPLTRELYRDDRFVRLKWLQRLLGGGSLDSSLRRLAASEVVR